MLEKMFDKLIDSFDKKFNRQPVEYQPTEVVDAFNKVDRILASAWMPTHVDTAEKMMAHLLHRFAFTVKHCESPLIVGMQERINNRREEIERMWVEQYSG